MKSRFWSVPGLIRVSLLLSTILLGAQFIAYAQNGGNSSEHSHSETRISGFFAEGVAEQRLLESDLITRHNAETYREHLRRLTEYPNVAGTPENEAVIAYLIEITTEAGLEVSTYNYDVWLAEPGEVSIRILEPELLTLPNKERRYPQDPSTSHPSLTHGWNAYSASGSVQAEIVYVNYGRREDFQELARRGIDLSGRIALARYGGNFRGYKAKYAEEAGAAGLIIYTDPANGGFVNGTVYPDGIFSNDSAIQRGSLLTLPWYGDPLTPFDPALPLDEPGTPQRLNPVDIALPTIPVAPIGYGAAEMILSRMQGEPVSPEWQGGFTFPYQYTGGPDLIVELTVDQPHDFKRITNVIGTIEGSVYPDEWIILGSHFDAWGFGATDPNSDTAMLLTLTESLGALLTEGYRPKRSIMFAHWDAEEFMLIGSTEWVEQLLDELQASAIAYINADMSVTGPNPRASAAPSLKQPIIESARFVIHPDTNASLYDVWGRNAQTGEVSIGNLGGGSDHMPFYMLAGIPSAGVALSGPVPIYHTNYDTFWFYENHIDSTFQYGPTLASLYGVLALRLANSDLLPYDLMRYPSDLKSHMNGIGIRARELGIDIVLDSLSDALVALEESTRETVRRLDALMENGQSSGGHAAASPLQLAQINNRLIQLERSFLNEDGLPFSEWFKSVYAAIDPWSGYASWMLPGLRYVIERTDEHPFDEALFNEQRDNLIRSVELLNARIREIGELAVE